MGDLGNGQLPDAAFRKIVESLAIPILVIAEDGTITYFGGGASQAFRAEASEVVGRNIVEFLPPDQVDDAVVTMAELADHEAVGLGVPPVYQIVRPDGTGTWQAIGAQPLLDDRDVEGIPMYFMAFDAQLHLDESLAELLAGAPLTRVLDRLSTAMSDFFEAPGAAIHWGFHDERFTGVSASGVPPACLELVAPPWLEVARTGEPSYLPVDDLPEDARAAAADVGLAGMWALPVAPHPSIDPAVLTIWRATPHRPVTAHESVIARCLRYIQLVLVRHAEQEQLLHLANHDPLTGTANRLRFRDRLSRALASDQPTSVLYCDMDRFKAVNDSLGHQAGDAVLVELVERLQQVLRPSDELCRIGGDEFTVILQGDLGAAAEVAHRLAAEAEQPFEVASTKVAVALSIGIAQARAGDTPDDLLRRADGALYEAKRDPHRQIALAP